MKDVFHTVDRVTHRTDEMPVAALVGGGVSRQMDDTEIVARGGATLAIEHCAAPIKDESGAVKGVVIVFRDITERTRAEAALRESEEQYRAVYSQAATGIAEADLSGRFVRANDRFCEIVGYPREGLLGVRFGDLTHPDDRAESVGPFERLIDGGPSYTIEKRYVRRDGLIVWARVAVSLIRDEAGRPARVAAVIEDITDRKRLEDELRRRVEELAAGRPPQGRVPRHAGATSSATRSPRSATRCT